MSLEDKIEKVKKISSSFEPQKIVQEPNRDYFEALMQQKSTRVDQQDATPAQVAKETQKSLFDEVRELNSKSVTRSSPTEIVTQAEDVVAQIDVLKSRLETPGAEIQTSAQTLLRNKLNHVDESLRMALEKTGGEYKVPEVAAAAPKNPVERFLGMLTHAQSQLQTLASDVRAIAQNHDSFNPANMLLIQMKVGFVAQEMELFTSMLNKSLESTKAIMNVQI
jgi:hypothetical protein